MDTGETVEEMKPSSEIEVQRVCKDMAEAIEPVVALFQQTTRGSVYFEGQKRGVRNLCL